MLLSKCAASRNGAHFLNISTSKSAAELRCFVHFAFEMCFTRPRQFALSEHLNVQKCSDAEVLLTFWLRNVLRATMAFNVSSPWKPRTSKSTSLWKSVESRLQKYVHAKSSWHTFWGLMAKKERCYKPPVDVPFEALWLKRNVAINILESCWCTFWGRMAKKERCYNMLYHALKHTYIALLHIKSLHPNPVLCIGVKYSVRKNKCVHACIVAPHCKVCIFSKWRKIKNRE